MKLQNTRTGQFYFAEKRTFLLCVDRSIRASGPCNRREGRSRNRGYFAYAPGATGRLYAGYMAARYTVAMPEEIEVPTEHLHETLKEHAEEAPVRWIGKAALSSALIAVAAAIASLLAGHNANEAMLEQMQATDEWAFYQAKGIKSAVLETRLQLLEAMGKPVSDGDRQKLAGYDGGQRAIEDKGHELEAESRVHMQRHSVLARSVTIFQISIAMAAIAVLVRRRSLWFVSMGFGLAGTVFLVRGLV